MHPKHGRIALAAAVAALALSNCVPGTATAEDPDREDVLASALGFGEGHPGAQDWSLGPQSPTASPGAPAPTQGVQDRLAAARLAAHAFFLEIPEAAGSAFPELARAPR